MGKEVEKNTSKQANEERIEEMIELEERLLDSQLTEELERRDEGEDDSNSPTPGGVETGIVKTITQRGRDLEIEFIVGTDTYTDRIPAPTESSDPDEPINVLCRLCGVRMGLVTQLQGQEIPVEWDVQSETYNIVFPDTGTKPALYLFKAWLLARKYNQTVVVDIAKVTGAIGIALGSVWLSMVTLYAIFAYSADTYVQFSEILVGLVLHLDPLAYSGMNPILSMGVLILGAISIPFSAFALLVTGSIAYGWFRDNIWPF